MYIRNNGRKSRASGSGGCVLRRGWNTTVMLESRRTAIVVGYRKRTPCVCPRLRSIVNAMWNVRQAFLSSPFSPRILMGNSASGTLYIANIVQLWNSLLFSRKEKEMSFDAVSWRPRTLTNYCGRCAMLTRAESKSQWSATGVRLDGISLRRNLISSRARVRGNAIECLARIGYPTLARRARGNVVRIGPSGDLRARRKRGSEMGTPLRTDVVFFRWKSEKWGFRARRRSYWISKFRNSAVPAKFTRKHNL